MRGAVFQGGLSTSSGDVVFKGPNAPVWLVVAPFPIRRKPTARLISIRFVQLSVPIPQVPIPTQNNLNL